MIVHMWDKHMCPHKHMCTFVSRNNTNTKHELHSLLHLLRCTCRYIVDIFIAEHLCARHLIAEYWGLDIHVCMFVLMSVMLRNAISCTLVVTLECISLMYTLYYVIICVRTFINGLPLPCTLNTCTSWPYIVHALCKWQTVLR